jgi:hypothetical protein
MFGEMVLLTYWEQPAEPRRKALLLKSKTKLAIYNQLSADLLSGGMLRRPTMP